MDQFYRSRKSLCPYLPNFSNCGPLQTASLLPYILPTVLRTVIGHTVLGVLKQFTTLRRNMFNTSAQDLCAFDQLTVCYRCLRHLTPEHQLCAQHVCGVRWLPALKNTRNKSATIMFTKIITNFCKKSWDDNLRSASITLHSCASPDPCVLEASMSLDQQPIADRSFLRHKYWW